MNVRTKTRHNLILWKSIEKSQPYGYNIILHTLVIWKHENKPTTFCLCVDEFGINIIIRQMQISYFNISKRITPQLLIGQENFLWSQLLLEISQWICWRFDARLCPKFSSKFSASTTKITPIFTIFCRSIRQKYQGTTPICTKNWIILIAPPWINYKGATNCCQFSLLC